MFVPFISFVSANAITKAIPLINNVETIAKATVKTKESPNVSSVNAFI